MDPPHAIPRQGVIATVARRGVSVHHTRSQTGGVLDEELSTTIHRAQTAMRRGVVRVSGRIAVLLVGLLHRAFAHDPANYLFVASQTRPEITIIDSSTDELVGRITLPSVPGDMSALGRGRSLAIADRKASQVHFVDVLARRVRKAIRAD